MPAATATDADAPLWRPIPLTQYEVPEAPTREGLARIWQRLRSHGSDDDDEINVTDPEEVGSRDLVHLVPALDLEAASTSLDAELEGWRDGAPEAPRSVALVAPPGGAAQEILALWAERAGLVPVEPPSRADLAAGTARCELPGDASTPLLLPPLERLFLRRVGGLECVRALLETLQRERRRYVAASDSWSWTFLRQTLHGRIGFDRILCPSPFDGAALATWIGGLGAGVTFIDAENGKPLLGGDDEPHRFLRTLAGRARGNPGVAAAHWRRALGSARIGAGRDGTRTCWLPYWRDIGPPDLPTDAGKSTALVLHALLVHAGIEEDRLPAVLPEAVTDVRPILWHLAGKSVIDEEDGVWRVPASGYAVARSFVAALNLPLDPF